VRSIARIVVPLLLVAGGLLAGCGGGGDTAPTRTTIAGARKTGSHAKATIEAIVRHPGTVAIRTSVAPKQHVLVTWGLSCPRTAHGKDNGSGGTYTATPPDVHTLTLPHRDIAFCAVRAEAQLVRKGRVKVAVLAGHG
jgi:hypothetical protein